jgi:hypothetical protein
MAPIIDIEYKSRFRGCYGTCFIIINMFTCWIIIRKVSLDGSEEAATNMNDKLKLLKTRHNSLGQSHAFIDAKNVVHTITLTSK